MSVLILTPGGFDLIRETVRHLRAQTARERLELVVVAPSREALGHFELETEGFARVRVVEAGEIRRAASAKAEGVRAARAAVVAFAEEHCYPEPEWAGLLLAAHARGWDAVGPQMCNANPSSAVSRAGLYLNYGPCLAPAEPGPSHARPWHNVSYRRELLGRAHVRRGARAREEVDAASQARLRRRRAAHPARARAPRAARSLPNRR